LGLARDARRHVDSGAEDVTSLLDDLAGVDADADAELALRVLLAVLGDASLDLDRAFDGVAARAEADHDAVAETLYAAAGVLADLLFDDRLVRLHDLVREGEAPARQHRGRALDVGEHDRHRALGLARGETADDGVRGQRLRSVDRLPQAFGDQAEQVG